jgi:DNA-binding response OmpR family regulator
LPQRLLDNLLSEGFDTQCVNDGSRALATAAAFKPDLIVLDLMLPGVSGFDLCRAFHDASETPILVLTARSQKADKVRCLDYGADDYLTKPFDLDELLARIRAILRRTRPSLETLTIGSITVDFRSRLAVRDNTDLRLTHKEFEILQYLAERQGHVVHRDELLKDLWGYAQAPVHAIGRYRHGPPPQEDRGRRSSSALHSHSAWRRLLPDTAWSNYRLSAVVGQLRSF